MLLVVTKQKEKKTYWFESSVSTAMLQRITIVGQNAKIGVIAFGEIFVIMANVILNCF